MNCPGFGFSRHLLNEFLPNFFALFVNRFLTGSVNSLNVYRHRLLNIEHGLDWILQHMLKYVLMVHFLCIRRKDTYQPDIPFRNILKKFQLFFQLALKDVEKLINLRSNSAKSYILKAEALSLVRKCCYPRFSLCKWLSIHPPGICVFYAYFTRFKPLNF